MKKKILPILVLLASCPAVFAKNLHPLCVDAQGGSFTSGDGQRTNPYLICNHEQFAQLAAESTVTTHYYRLGTDLDFNGRVYPLIGAANAPFKGGFDGDGYTLSDITLSGDGNLGVFSALQNADIENLNIDGIYMRGFPANHVAGLAGTAEGSTIANIHVKGIDLDAGDFSGGLVGELIDSTVDQTSTEGTLINRAGTDASGGLIGQALTSDITNSASHVNLVNTADLPAGGPSAIGGLVGSAFKCRIKEVYADGEIDYSLINPIIQIGEVAGLIGQSDSSFFSNAYYAGKISINPSTVQVENLGGAVGFNINSVMEDIFWDTQVSGVSVSAAGIGKTTSMMKKKTMWKKAGFDPHFWLVKPNQYPTLVGIDNVG